MALLSRVLARITEGPAWRVRLVQLALLALTGCGLLALASLAARMGAGVVRESHRVLDFELGQPGSGAGKELRIGIRVADGAGGTKRPQYSVGEQAVHDLAELRGALASQFRGADTPVVIAASDDAQHGWLIAVIDCLRELSFTNVRIGD